MKTYIKIYGPPVMEALNELRRIAGEMPQVSHFHFMASYEGGRASIEGGLPPPQDSVEEKTITMFKKSPISKSGHTLGDYDFFFEWEHDPLWFEMSELISRIDKAFSKLGCKYTLTTK